MKYQKYMQKEVVQQNNFTNAIKKIEIIEAIAIIKQLATVQPSKEITKKIEEIQEICNKKYFFTSYYGDTALNRMILRDLDISNLLTPDVLKYIKL